MTKFLETVVWGGHTLFFLLGVKGPKVCVIVGTCLVGWCGHPVAQQKGCECDDEGGGSNCGGQGVVCCVFFLFFFFSLKKESKSSGMEKLPSLALRITNAEYTTCNQSIRKSSSSCCHHRVRYCIYKAGRYSSLRR